MKTTLFLNLFMKHPQNSRISKSLPPRVHTRRNYP